VYRALPREPAIEAPITLVYRSDTHSAVADRFLALARRIAKGMAPARRRR
jgi:hypothetical protein